MAFNVGATTTNKIENYTTPRDATESGGHGFLEPAWEMPFEEYQGYLHGTAGSWGEVVP